MFIVFEGIDGCGKSTQIRLLEEKLAAAGKDCLLTCEPTDSPFGKLLRDVLTHRIQADNRVLAPLFAADRMDHILRKDGLLAARDAGKTILCDRYYFSNYAYQSLSLPLSYVIGVNEPCADLLRPDITFFLDVPPEVSMRRISANREQTELFEKEELLRCIREQYFRAFDAVREKERIEVIDGTGTPEETARAVWEALKR